MAFGGPVCERCGVLDGHTRECLRGELRPPIPLWLGPTSCPSVEDVVAHLRARAAELDARSDKHRAGHGRRESKSVRAKYAAQARELRRVLAWIAAQAAA